jgi:uncharacterized protein
MELVAPKTKAKEFTVYPKIGLSLLLALLMVGCAAQPATVAPNPPVASTALVWPTAYPSSTAATAPAVSAGEAHAQTEFIATANKFANLLIAQQDYAGAVDLFDDTMKAALPDSKLKEIWETLPKQVGVFQSRSDARLAAGKDQYQQVIVPLQYEKAALNMLVVVNVNTGQISGLFFQPNQDAQNKLYKTPAYVDPDKFEEKDITFGSEPWKLPGTLTLPKGAGPFPAVVLVHGSGPNDRDETIGPNKPFKDIAQGLASQGIAVLRYDKRTKVYGAVMAKTADQITVKEEVLDDATAAIEFLRQQPGVDPKWVFVLGHSLGGYLAPRIAQGNPNIAGEIILAGAARPLEDLIAEQTQFILDNDQTLSAQQKQLQLSQIQQQIEAVKTLTAQSSVKDVLFGMSAPYWLDLKIYQPAELARNLIIPLFILQGERDYQVTMQDFEIWKNALAGHDNVQLKSYADLNHLFISGTGKSLPAEYQTPANVSTNVIQDMAAWIQQQK